MQSDSKKLATGAVPHKKRGFNMLEVGIYLVIAGALLYVLVPMGKNQVDRIKAWLFSRQMTEIQVAVEAINNANNNYASATDITDSVRMEGGISSAYYTQTGVTYTYESPWDGALLVSATNNNWTLTVDAIPAAACLYWLTNPAFKDLAGVTVNDNAQVMQTDGSVAAVAATTACGAGSSNEIVWTVN